MVTEILPVEGSDAEMSIAIQRRVAALWNEVLQTDLPVCGADDFFALGGDSMTMVMLEFRIREELEVVLPTGALLEAPTLQALSALVYTAASNLKNRNIPDK